MIEKWQCLYIGVFIYGGTIVALFLRAFVRRKLLRDHDNIKGVDTEAVSGDLSSKLFAFPRQFKALSEVSSSLVEAPTEVKRRYRSFQLLTWVATVFLVLLIIFSILAHKICGV